MQPGRRLADSAAVFDSQAGIVEEHNFEDQAWAGIGIQRFERGQGSVQSAQRMAGRKRSAKRGETVGAVEVNQR